MDAEEALRIGLVDQVVPDADVYRAATRLAGQFVSGPALALRAARVSRALRRYRNVRQCAGLQAGGEGGRTCAGHNGRSCCSMYWCRTLMGAPPADPAKYDPDRSRFARQ